jgi:hypothetical protein
MQQMPAVGDAMSGRYNRSMARRPPWDAAANDNVPPARRRQTRTDGVEMPVVRRRFAASHPEPFRIGARPLAIAGLAGLMLMALSGAFLIGLAAVGVLAIAIAVGEMIYRHVNRRPPLAGHRVTG